MDQTTTVSNGLSSEGARATRSLHLFQQEGLTPRAVAAFQHLIYAYYRQHGRVFPWRQTTDPYHILVSEIMLQQTQTSRVLEKYEQFVAEFPSFSLLGVAPLRRVLQMWQGLGYNRRAIALRGAAQVVVTSFDGDLPSSPDVLISLPGIGRYTASALAALAFNQPAVFIETNIRTVFLRFFFHDKSKVADREILPLVTATLDRSNPREWYYALFDYGAMLKKTENLASKSAHHRRQSPFKGSNREVRGQIIRLLLAHSTLSAGEIAQYLQQNPATIDKNLDQLQREGFISDTGAGVRIT